MAKKSPAPDGFERIREQYPPIITTAQVAELLDINARTVLMMAADGRLPASRLPGSRKFHFVLEDVLGTLRRNMVNPGDRVIDEELSQEAEESSSGRARRPKTGAAAASTRARRPPGSSRRRAGN
ncbi:MAG TPA: helix-turn-helix domain-containing protein [Acidimicrobiales bacterium]|nr:helix-turn-helix domain-containing protein [Acidimicrobiales bacterium]